jgi:hypothetical protein
MKWFLLLGALLLPGANHPVECSTQARWPQSWEGLPTPDDLGHCPRSFESWRWDKKRDTICVRRA